MAKFEMVREILNLCQNSQMRDVFFEDVECDDPVQYVRSLLTEKNAVISAERGKDCTIVNTSVDGLMQKFVFSEI